MGIKRTTSSRQIDRWIQNQQYPSFFCSVKCIFEPFSADPFVNFNPKSIENLGHAFISKVWKRSDGKKFFDRPYWLLSCNTVRVISKTSCHNLVLILILISIETRSNRIFGQKPPPTNWPMQGTQSWLTLPKLLTFQVIHQNKSFLS